MLILFAGRDLVKVYIMLTAREGDNSTTELIEQILLQVRLQTATKYPGVKPAMLGTLVNVARHEGTEETSGSIRWGEGIRRVDRSRMRVTGYGVEQCLRRNGSFFWNGQAVTVPAKPKNDA